MNIQTATPAEIDAEIARINGEAARYEAQVVRAQDRLVQLQASRYYDAQRDADKVAELKNDIDAGNRSIVILRAERAPFDAEFTARGGWTRFYLVEDGHLHYDVSGHRCSRIPSTSHYWLTEQSGQTAETVIELAGDRVCTVCFPNAPVAAQGRPSQLLTKTEAEKDQARAERLQKRLAAENKRNANAITAADGGKLQDAGGSRIDTVTAAKSEYFECCERIAYYGDRETWLRDIPENLTAADFEENRVWNLGRFEATRQEVLAALAAKFETTPEAYAAEQAKKVTARIRKDRREADKFRAQLGR